MAKRILVKRSAVQGKAPSTTDLDLGEIAINTYDGKMYIKKDDGSESIVEVTGGNGSSNSSNIEEMQFTASDGQTDFTITNKVFTTKQCEVYTNRLVDYKSEYSVSDNGTDTTISFNNGKQANDIVRVVTYV